VESLEAARKFLSDLGRTDLSALIEFSTVEISAVQLSPDDFVTRAVIASNPSFTEALKGLADNDKQRIADAFFKDVEFGDERDYFESEVEFRASRDIDVTDDQKLFPEVLLLIDQMISVATGGPRIDSVNDYYKARYRFIDCALRAREVEHLNPHTDLWAWYKKWSESFPTYQERRNYIHGIYDPIVSQLLAARSVPEVQPREPTGWERVDRAIVKGHRALAAARHEEDFQSVGLFCREVLISLGEAVYDRERHGTAIDGVEIGPSDGVRMIQAFLNFIATGDANSKLRKHAKASSELAVELQHKRTADRRAAALCLEATASITNIVSILAGRRD
jgi:hypothetical protein